jgi:hypothetical protein
VDDRPDNERDLDIESLDPDDTEQQLHPGAPLPSPPDPADDEFEELPDYQVNDG